MDTDVGSGAGGYCSIKIVLPGHYFLICGGLRVFASIPGPLPQALLEELEPKVAGLWAKIYEEGDSTAVEKLVKDKDEGEARVAKLYAEVGLKGHKGS